MYYLKVGIVRHGPTITTNLKGTADGPNTALNLNEAAVPLYRTGYVLKSEDPKAFIASPMRRVQQSTLLACQHHPGVPVMTIKDAGERYFTALQEHPTSQIKEAMDGVTAHHDVAHFLFFGNALDFQKVARKLKEVGGEGESWEHFVDRNHRLAEYLWNTYKANVSHDEIYHPSPDSQPNNNCIIVQNHQVNGTMLLNAFINFTRLQNNTIRPDELYDRNLYSFNQFDKCGIHWIEIMELDDGTMHCPAPNPNDTTHLLRDYPDIAEELSHPDEIIASSKRIIEGGFEGLGIENKHTSLDELLGQ